MTMTFKSMKALGKAVRQKSPIDLQMPVEMQVALLRLVTGRRAEPLSGTPRLLDEEDQQEATEPADEDGRQAQETRLTG